MADGGAVMKTGREGDDFAHRVGHGFWTTGLVPLCGANFVGGTFQAPFVSFGRDECPNSGGVVGIGMTPEFPRSLLDL